MSTTPLQSTSAKTPRAERTQQRILDAAGQGFAANGYAKTTVEDVASRAGVSKALVHHHFGTKERILEAVCNQAPKPWQRVRTPLSRTESSFRKAVSCRSTATPTIGSAP